MGYVSSLKSPYSEFDIALSISEAWDSLKQLAEQSKNYNVLVLLDSRVDHFHGSALRECFATLQHCHIETFQANEHAKLGKYVAALVEHLSRLLPARSDSRFIAIGGGVTLNVGGFLASVIGRGLELFLVPTTPMAIADVAFGSKHGVNCTTAKNYFGSYYDPTQVLINVNAISSLSPRQVKQNSVESLKQFLLTDAALFDRLVEFYAAEKIEPREFFDCVLYPSALQKMHILHADPHEKGKGRILLFGHQVAHSLEVASNFHLPHDKAVAMGMYVELRELARRDSMRGRVLNSFLSAMSKAGIEFSGIRFDPAVFNEAMRNGKLISGGDHMLLLNVAGVGALHPTDLFIEWSLEEAIARTIEWLE